LNEQEIANVHIAAFEFEENTCTGRQAASLEGTTNT